MTTPPEQPQAPPAAAPPALSAGATHELLHRLSTVEHENRKLRRQGVTMLVVTAVLLGLAGALTWTAARHGLPGFVPDVVEAREFVLRDHDGRVRGAWGHDDQGAIRLVLQDTRSQTSIKLNLLDDGSSGLTFADSSGIPRLVVAVLPDETVNLVFGDRRGVTRTVLGLAANGASPELEALLPRLPCRGARRPACRSAGAACHSCGPGRRPFPATYRRRPSEDQRRRGARARAHRHRRPDPDPRGARARRGCRISARGRLCYPRALVEDVIAGTPKTIHFLGQDAKHDLEIGGTRVHTYGGGEAVNMLDVGAAKYRPSTLADVYDAARLVDCMENIHAFSRLVVATEIADQRACDISTAYASVAGTAKNVVLTFNCASHVQPTLDIAQYEALFTRDGRQFGLPKYHGALALFYNKDLFDKAGVDYPTGDWDHEDYLQAMQQLTLRSGNQTTQWGSMVDVAWERIQMHVNGWGGHFVDPENPSKCVMAESAAVNAMEWLRARIWDDRVMATFLDVQTNSTRRAFVDQKVVMVEDGSWALKDILDTATFRVGVAPFPAGPERRVTLATTDGFG